jgi:hypothetical protein
LKTKEFEWLRILRLETIKVGNKMIAEHRYDGIEFNRGFEAAITKILDHFEQLPKRKVSEGKPK